MSKADQKHLRIKLAALMDEHKNNWPGHPYVAEDGTFGVKAGKLRGGLYAAYFLIDSLAAGGLFKGSQNPRTDLDTAVYELAPDKVFNVYDEAELFWNKDGELQVRITTEKPLADIVAAIDHGIRDAQEEKDRKAKQKQAYDDKVKADKQRDKMPTVFSKETDLAFAAEYLRMKVEEEVPSRNIVVDQETPDPHLADLLEDERPRLRAEYDLDPEADFGPVNRFNNEVLREVFRGEMSVSFNMTVKKGERMDVSLAGTPARLTADILDHDLEGARKVLASLSGSFSEQTRKKVKDEIDRRYSLQVAQSLKDNLQGAGVHPKRPASFKNLK